MYICMYMWIDSLYEEKYLPFSLSVQKNKIVSYMFLYFCEFCHLNFKPSKIHFIYGIKYSHLMVYSKLTTNISNII